jgi:hypothetical protein
MSLLSIFELLLIFLSFFLDGVRLALFIIAVTLWFIISFIAINLKYYSMIFFTLAPIILAVSFFFPNWHLLVASVMFINILLAVLLLPVSISKINNRNH